MTISTFPTNRRKNPTSHAQILASPASQVQSDPTLFFPVFPIPATYFGPIPDPETFKSLMIDHEMTDVISKCHLKRNLLGIEVSKLRKMLFPCKTILAVSRATPTLRVKFSLHAIILFTKILNFLSKKSWYDWSSLCDDPFGFSCLHP